MVAEGKRSVAQLERDLDITSGLIYKWQQRYRVENERLQPSAERAEQAELRRLKRELEIVKQERDILKKNLPCWGPAFDPVRNLGVRAVAHGEGAV
jgi:transposase